MERNSWNDCRFHNRNRSHDAQQLRVDVDFQFRSIDATIVHWRRSWRYSEIACHRQSQSVGWESLWATRIMFLNKIILNETSNKTKQKKQNKTKQKKLSTDWFFQSINQLHRSVHAKQHTISVASVDHTTRLIVVVDDVAPPIATLVAFAATVDVGAALSDVTRPSAAIGDDASVGSRAAASSASRATNAFMSASSLGAASGVTPDSMRWVPSSAPAMATPPPPSSCATMSGRATLHEQCCL